MTTPKTQDQQSHIGRTSGTTGAQVQILGSSARDIDLQGDDLIDKQARLRNIDVSGRLALGVHMSLQDTFGARRSAQLQRGFSLLAQDVVSPRAAESVLG